MANPINGASVGAGRMSVTQPLLSEEAAPLHKRCTVTQTLLALLVSWLAAFYACLDAYLCVCSASMAVSAENAAWRSGESSLVV